MRSCPSQIHKLPLDDTDYKSSDQRLQSYEMLDFDRKEVKKNFSAVEHNNVLYVIGGGTEEQYFNKNFFLKPEP